MELKTENDNDNTYYIKSNNSSDEYNAGESSADETSDNEDIKHFIINKMKNDKNKIKELEIKLQIKQEETKQKELDLQLQIQIKQEETKQKELEYKTNKLKLEEKR